MSQIITHLFFLSYVDEDEKFEEVYVRPNIGDMAKLVTAVQQISIEVERISSDIQDVLEFLDKVEKRLQKIVALQQRPSQPTVIFSKNRMLFVLPKLPISCVEPT
jgi:hypothetical protein